MSVDDVLLWADGTWCYYSELFEMSHMSDDYEVIVAGSARWHEVVAGETDFQESTFDDSMLGDLE